MSGRGSGGGGVVTGPCLPKRPEREVGLWLPISLECLSYSGTQLDKDRPGPHQEVTRVPCQVLGKDLLLKNITPLRNGDYFSNSLRNHSHVTIRSCKGRLDLYTGHINKQRAKYFKHVVLDQDTRRPYMHILIHTGKAVIENKVLADNWEGVTGTK